VRVMLKIILLPILGFVVLAGCTRGRDSAAQPDEPARDPGYSASDAEILQMDADGLPRYRLQAQHIEQDPQSLEVALEGIRLETRERATASWQVTAPQGRLSSDSQRLRLTGGVVLEGGSARDADRLRVRTAALQYDLGSAQVRAAGKVEVNLQGHVLAGTGLDANLRTRQVRLQTDVHGRFAR
jgi:lipopolysaccharide export system protein LptC